MALSEERINRASEALLSSLFLMLSDHEKWGNVFEIMSALHYASYKFNRALLDVGVVTPEQWLEIKENMDKAADSDFNQELCARVKEILTAKQKEESPDQTEKIP